MGYSNNKWRKILTILMIINLCFILFAKISKVSAVDIDVPVLNETIYIDDSLNDYNFLLFFRPVGAYNEYYADIIITENTRSFLLRPDNSSNPNLIYMSTKGSYYSHTFRGTVAQLKNTFSTFTSSSFILNSTSFDGSPSLIGTFTGVSTVYNSDNFYTNSPVYNYSSSSVIVEPNVVFFNPPFFDNVTEIENGYPDGVFISRRDFSENETLYFHLLKIIYTVTDNSNTIYYYSPKIFALDKNSKYYYTWDNDVENKFSYYYVPRSELGLDTNSSYLYVLTNSSNSFTNSNGIIVKDVANSIYDVVESDTTGVITSEDSSNDKLQNIDDTLNDDTVSSDTETNIEDSLNFDNHNEGLNNLNNGFFSRLTSMLSNLLGYDLSDDTVVRIPFPNSQKYLELHSNILYNNVTGGLRLIINAFWLYIFAFYMYKFVNKLYIAISTGNILDTFSSSGEAITNNML